MSDDMVTAIFAVFVALFMGAILGAAIMDLGFGRVFRFWKPRPPEPKICEKCGHDRFREPSFDASKDKLRFECKRCAHKQFIDPLTKWEKK